MLNFFYFPKFMREYKITKNHVKTRNRLKNKKLLIFKNNFYN